MVHSTWQSANSAATIVALSAAPVLFRSSVFAALSAPPILLCLLFCCRPRCSCCLSTALSYKSVSVVAFPILPLLSSLLFIGCETLDKKRERWKVWDGLLTFSNPMTARNAHPYDFLRKKNFVYVDSCGQHAIKIGYVEDCFSHIIELVKTAYGCFRNAEVGGLNITYFSTPTLGFF